jgi:hypothetical protein
LRGRGGDEVEEPAAELEPERGAGLHLVEEAGVVEAQAGDRFAQLPEIGRVDREQAAEHTGWTSL